ncbi:hypothetical protein D4R86_04430 [bacterium]|nr:MAG: hypothetical protein D4R86_04430 [bacterium]
MRKTFYKFTAITYIFLFGLIVFAAPAKATTSTNFYVDAFYDISSRGKIEAELFYESDQAYFYIENSYLDRINRADKLLVERKIKTLSKEFDENIYPKLTDLFGDVWNPGIDNDSKITILFSRLMGGVGGYFDPSNEYDSDNVSDSNEREMIYINTDYILDNRLKSYVAHEFQHLISYNQKEKIHNIADDIWLNELRSEYVSTYLGYDAEDYQNSNLKIRVDKFEQYSSDSLTEWRGRIYDYSSINMLGQYMADHYGKQFFRELIESDKSGIKAVNDALNAIGIEKTFDEVFSDWVVACYINNTEKGALYGYTNPLLKNLKINPTATYEIFGNLIIQRAALMKEWSPFWYEIEPGQGEIGNIKLNFSGTPARGNFKIKTIKIDFSNNYVVSDWPLNENNQGEILISGFGNDIQKIIVIPYVSYEGQYQDETLDYNNFTFIIEAQNKNQEVLAANGTTINETQNNATQTAFYSSLSDGDLVRAKGDYKVYIIKGEYKRHIESGEIFGFYEHLNWGIVKEISRYELNLYKESNLIRTDGDKKVYEIDEMGQKHWLNISGEEFINSERDWNSVYIINKAERDFYLLGEDVLL